MILENIIFDDNKYKRLIEKWLSRGASFVECRIENITTLSITIQAKL